MTKRDIICHAEGDRCHGCAHYRGEADVCECAPKAPPMSEAIPSDILDHAYDLVEAMQSNKMDALTADYNRYSSMLTDDANAIARALMAAAREADEAATMRERERCAARIETLEDMVFSAYQFAGAVLDYAGLFEHPEGVRALDYFSSNGEEELLPWPNCDLSPAAILKGEV